MIRLHLRSLAAVALTAAATAVALVMSAVEAVGRAQDLDAPVPFVPTENSPLYDALYAEAIERAADERALCFEDCDFEEWDIEYRTREEA